MLIHKPHAELQARAGLARTLPGNAATAAWSSLLKLDQCCYKKGHRRPNLVKNKSGGKLIGSKQGG